MDRQTDRQTDGQNSSLYLVCVTCSPVKMKLLEVEGARAPVLHIAGDATGVDACDLHRQRCCTFHGRCTKPSAPCFPRLPLRESGTCYISPAITSLPSLQTFKHALIKTDVRKVTSKERTQTIKPFLGMPLHKLGN